MRAIFVIGNRLLFGRQRRRPLPQIINFIVGAIHESPVFYNYTKQPPACHPERKNRVRFCSRSFVERIAIQEPKNASRLEGISKRVLVAFCIDVTSRQQATEICCEIPRRLTPCDFSSLLARKNFDFAQDDLR